MASIDLKGTRIRLRDGSTPTNYIEIKIGEGNLTWSEKRDIHFIKSRGDLDQVREGDELEMDVTLQFLWEFLHGTDADPPTFEDVLKHRGPATNWLSVTPVDVDPDAPFCISIDILYDPICGDEEKENYILEEFHYTSLSHSLRDGTVDCNGSCNRSQALVSRI